MGAMQQISVDEADIVLSELLDRAARGEEITTSRAGRPIARLVPAPTLRDPEAAEALVESFRELREELVRSGVKPFTIDEIVASIHEGHKY
jgi:prevent-host-death family protein